MYLLCLFVRAKVVIRYPIFSYPCKAFIGYYVVDNSHYFIFDEEDGDDKWTSVYVKNGDVVNLYTRIDQTVNTNSIVFHELKIYLPSGSEKFAFYQVQLDVDEIIDRQVFFSFYFA